jgi:hypothetical protein
VGLTDVEGIIGTPAIMATSKVGVVQGTLSKSAGFLPNTKVHARQKMCTIFIVGITVCNRINNSNIGTRRHLDQVPLFGLMNAYQVQHVASAVMHKAKQIGIKTPIKSVRFTDHQKSASNAGVLTKNAASVKYADNRNVKHDEREREHANHDDEDEHKKKKKRKRKSVNPHQKKRSQKKKKSQEKRSKKKRSQKKNNVCPRLLRLH